MIQLLSLLMGLAGMGLVFAIIWQGLQQARQKQELAHAERIKALEMGVPVATQHAWPAAVCICIGAVVPVAALLVAMITSLSAPRPEPLSAAPLVRNDGPIIFLTTVWATSMIVGVAGVIAGTLLAWRLLGRKPVRDAELVRYEPLGKPAFDPDALDTVGRRG